MPNILIPNLNFSFKIKKIEKKNQLKQKRV